MYALDEVTVLNVRCFKFGGGCSSLDTWLGAVYLFPSSLAIVPLFFFSVEGVSNERGGFLHSKLFRRPQIESVARIVPAPPPSLSYTYKIRGDNRVVKEGEEGGVATGVRGENHQCNDRVEEPE